MFVNPGSRAFQAMWMSSVAVAWMASSLVFFHAGHMDAGTDVPAYLLSLALWSSMSGVFGYWALLYVGHFGFLHPIPERSQIFTLVVTLALSALLSKYLTLLITSIEVLRYREILWTSPIAGIAAFSFEYLEGKAFVRSGKKRLGFLALRAPERAALEEVFRQRGLLAFYEFIDASVLPYALANPSDVHFVVISRAKVREFAESSSIILAYNLGIPVYDHVVLKNVISGRISTANYDSWAFLVQATKINFAQRFYRETRPWVERLIALTLFVLLSPILLLLTLLILAVDGGPALYRQKRLGFRGRVFEMIKFRSMREDAEASGPVWAKSNDPRVTKLGYFLRKTRLDELPQLWNVLCGQMSFVGPRPERPEFHEKLKEDVKHFDLRLLLRPGITGWSQIMAGYASSVDESRLKLEYDLFYLQHMSMRLDLVILFRTVMIVVGRQEFKNPSGS